MAAVCERALLLLLVTLAVLLGQRPAGAAISGDGMQQSAISSRVSFDGCKEPVCPSPNSNIELPSNIALYMPDTCDHSKMSMSVTDLNNTTSVALECYEEEDDKFNIVRLTSSARPSATSSQLIGVPINAWFSVSVSIREDNQLVFVVRADEGSPLVSNIFVQGTVVVPNWSANQEVRFTFDCHEEGFLADLNCLKIPRGPERSFGPRTSSPTLASDAPSGQGAQNIPFSTSNPTVGPAPGVVLTVTACGLLILVLALLFGLWHWQRRKLHQRRNSYQHQVLKRQTEGASFRRNQQSQTMELSLSDIEDQEQFQQLRPPAPARKPRTFVKVSRKDSQGNPLPATTDVSLTPDGDADPELTMYTNLPSPDKVSVSPPHLPLRGNASDVFQGASSTREQTPGQGGERGATAAKATIPNNNLLRSLSDEGGVTGPYWFHSTRKPDPKTALKIYRV